jgi:hypothetical protein
VEHPCYQCGATVEDGTAFCRHCNAPQIRVSLATPPAETAVVPEAAENQLLAYGRAPQITGLVWPHALRSAAQAGLIAAALMAIPLGASFGLGMLAAGFLSVLFYRRRVFHANLTSGLGIRLGALSGLFGFGIFAALSAVETAVFRSGGELRAALMQAVEQAASRNADPQAQQLLQYLKTPPGLVLVMILGLVVMFFLFLILSTLGGVLGALTLRRKERV